MFPCSLSEASPPNISNIQGIEITPGDTKDTLDKSNPKKIYDVPDDTSIYETILDPPAPPPSSPYENIMAESSA